VFLSFNETTWWVFERGTITGVYMPIMCRGMEKTCDKESLTCSARVGCCCGGRTPPAVACRGLVGGAAPPVVRKKAAAAAVESI
jgi:hypothetical protein